MLILAYVPLPRLWEMFSQFGLISSYQFNLPIQVDIE